MPRPVVFVPGLPASSLFDRVSGDRLFMRLPPDVERLRGPDDLDVDDGVVAGDPLPRIKIGFIDLMKFADSLYDLLGDFGVQGDLLAKVGWDWRRPVSDPRDGQVQERIGSAIDELWRVHRQKVILILHSTGGLAGRWFLEHADARFRDRIEAVVAFGVPWAGTLDAFAPLVGEQGIPFTSKRKVQRLMGHSWAAFDLLPPDPTSVGDGAYRAARLVVGPSGDGTGTLEACSPLTSTGWIEGTVPDGDLRAAMHLRAASAHQRLGTRSRVPVGVAAEVPIFAIVGWGEPTLRQAVLSADGAVRLSTERDGEPAPLDDGDGTVPRVSAAWLTGPNVDRFYVPIGRYEDGGEFPHARLWNNPGPAALLGSLIRDHPIAPWADAAMDWSDYVETSADVVTIRCTVVGADGDVPAGSRTRLHLGPVATSWTPLAPELGGRHLMRIEREDIPAVSGQPFRRLEVELDAPGVLRRRVPLLCRK